MKSLILAVFIGCVLAYAQAHLGWESRVEQVMDMAETVVKNQQYEDLCREQLKVDLDDLEGCKNLTSDLGTLATDLINSAQDIFNVTEDVVTIVELLNNCTKESIFKRAKCYSKVLTKITSLVEHYFSRIINISKTLVADAKEVVADISSCFHHKKIAHGVMDRKIQMCVRALSVRN